MAATLQEWKNWVRRFAREPGETSSAMIIQNQRQREHLWKIHPASDGCRRSGRPRPDRADRALRTP
jgi:hypothetical protein